jgi:hypothetical protein
MPYRLSATQLEAWRLWRDQDWMPESALIATLTRMVEPSHRMDVGTAFGDILATPDTFAVPNLIGGPAYYEHPATGLRFSADTMAGPLALFHREGLFEVKQVKRTRGGHQLVAKADQVLGLALVENKATLQGFDIDKYLWSLQWKVSAVVFEPVLIEYRVFCLGEANGGIFTVRDTHQFVLYPYPDVADEVDQVLDELAWYLRSRQIDHPLLRVK